MADIKDRILSLRVEKELTQEKMAKIFNVGLSTVSMWERGERIPRPKILQEICDYFNVDMDYLMGRSDIKNRYQAGLKSDWEEDKSDVHLDKSDDFKMVARDYNKLSEDKKKLFKSMMKHFMKSLNEDE